MNGIDLRYWTGSAVLHAVLIAALLWLQWSLRVPVRKAAALEWEVSFVDPAPPVVAPPAPAPPVHERAIVPPRPTPKPVANFEPPALQPAERETPSRQEVPAARSDVQGPVVPAPPVTPAPPAPQLPVADGAWIGQTLAGLMNARKRYPLQARRMGIEGKVVLEAVIDEQGRVLEAGIRNSSGSPILDQDALALLRSVPPVKPEKMKLAARTVVQIPVNYVLEQ